MIIFERFLQKRPEFNNMNPYPQFVPFLRTFLTRRNLGITWGTRYIHILYLLDYDIILHFFWVVESTHSLSIFVSFLEEAPRPAWPHCTATRASWTWPTWATAARWWCNAMGVWVQSWHGMDHLGWTSKTPRTHYGWTVLVDISWYIYSSWDIYIYIYR